MDIITQEIDTRPILFDHIKNGVEKIKKSGESDGTVNLSLDLTCPNKIEVEIYTKDDTYDLFILLRHVEAAQARSEIRDIPYNSDEKLAEAIDSIITAMEIRNKRKEAAYSLALEQLNRLNYRISDIKDIIACRNDAMIAAHKAELTEGLLVSARLIEDIREFVSDVLKGGEQ